MAVVIWMLARVTSEIDHQTRMRIVYAAIIIFAFRATPERRRGLPLVRHRRAGLRRGFYGVLQQLGAAIAIVAAWMLSDVVTRKPAAHVLLWLTDARHHPVAAERWGWCSGWTRSPSELFGVGARSIALFDAAATSPLVQLSMIPLLTLIAVYAPSGHRATWFALMASLMNLALTAGALRTKYLNLIFPVDRGDYANLPALVIAAIVISFVLPLSAILVFGRRVR